jgi:hypothetical protein
MKAMKAMKAVKARKPRDGDREWIAYFERELEDAFVRNDDDRIEEVREILARLDGAQP